MVYGWYHLSHLSDPGAEKAVEYQGDLRLFRYNSHRGCGQSFSRAATELFLEKYNFELLVRSHEVGQGDCDCRSYLIGVFLWLKQRIDCLMGGYMFVWMNVSIYVYVRNYCIKNISVCVSV